MEKFSFKGFIAKILILTIFFLPGCSSLGKFKQILRNQPNYSQKLSKGIEAYRKGNYEKARKIFTRIIKERPKIHYREKAQLYLARIALKQGNLKEAHQQYRYFSRNFPASKHIKEAKKELSLLEKGTTPSLNPKSGRNTVEKRSFLKTKTPEKKYGKFYGSITTEYLHDFQTSPPSHLHVHQSRLSEFLDLRWRKKWNGDLKIFFTSLYSYDFLVARNTGYRLSKFFGQWTDPKALMDLRFGRQPASGNTLFSRFDGLSMSYRPINSLSLNSSIGFPVNTFDKNKIEVQTDHWFYETSLTFNDFFLFGGKIYYTEELSEGFSTRQAIGLNSYWTKEDVSVNFILDYDLEFHKFNNELIGIDYKYQKIRYSGAFEHRKNPFLDYRNALFDPSLTLATPPILDFNSLQETKTRGEIKTLALGNTTDSLDFRLGVLVDFTKVWRGDFKYGHTISEQLDFNSGTETKHLNRLSFFISERNGLNFSEVWTLLTLYQIATDFQNITLSSALSKYWRLDGVVSLRFRFEHFDFKKSDTTFTRIIPGFAVNYTFRGGAYVSFEADYSIVDNNVSPDTLHTVRTGMTITVPF